VPEQTPISTPEVVPPPAPATWFDAAPDKADLTKLWTDKKWDTAKPDVVATEASRAYLAAQKLIGSPPDETLRYKPDNPEIMNGFYARIGVPKDVAGYDLAGIKLPDGSELDQSYTDMIRKTAYDNHLTPAQAKAIATSHIEWVAGQDKQDATLSDAAVASERATLQKNWGNDWSSNLLMAREGAKALGFDAEIVGTLEKTAGYAKIMEAMRSVGQRLREPGAVAGALPNSQAGALTREQAIDRKQQLMGDAAWRKRWYDNGQNGPEAREAQRLDMIISGIGR
jgi:hypothetical protein